MPQHLKNSDQNGNEIRSDEEIARQNRINRNLEKFLSQQPQQQQLLLCLKQQQQQQQQPRKHHKPPQQQQQQQPQQRVRMGAMTAMTVSYGHEAYLDHAVEMLDPDLKPVPPQPNCPQSMQVYDDHRLLAADYFKVQTELENMRNYKADLEAKLRESDAEMAEMAAKSDKEEVKKFVQLQKEKDSLIQFRDKLATQLQLIKKAQSKQQASESSATLTAKSPATSNLDEDWVLVHDSKLEKQ